MLTVIPTTLLCLALLCSTRAMPALRGVGESDVLPKLRLPSSEQKSSREEGLSNVQEEWLSTTDPAPTVKDNSSPPLEAPCDRRLQDASGNPALEISEAPVNPEGIQTSVRSKREVFTLRDLMDAVTPLNSDRLYPTKVHWYVQNLTALIERGRRLNYSNATSDYFVVAGYTGTLFLVIYADNGELWLGLFFVLCAGPNDAYLLWPFRTSYKLFMHHPTTHSKDKVVVTSPPIRGHHQSFKMPVGGCNVGIGHRKFLMVKEAVSEGYIADDAISVAVALTQNTQLA